MANGSPHAYNSPPDIKLIFQISTSNHPVLTPHMYQYHFTTQYTWPDKPRPWLMDVSCAWSLSHLIDPPRFPLRSKVASYRSFFSYWPATFPKNLATGIPPGPLCDGVTQAFRTVEGSWLARHPIGGHQADISRSISLRVRTTACNAWSGSSRFFQGLSLHYK
jgi:hypothetical protein